MIDVQYFKSSMISLGAIPLVLLTSVQTINQLTCSNSYVRNRKSPPCNIPEMCGLTFIKSCGVSAASLIIGAICVIKWVDSALFQGRTSIYFSSVFVSPIFRPFLCGRNVPALFQRPAHFYVIQYCLCAFDQG